MPSVCVFDPGMSNRQGQPSANLGDVIIQKSVERELVALFPQHRFVRVSTHESPAREEIDAAARSQYIIVGGSNIVGSYSYFYREWKIGVREIRRLRGRVILFGCGWGWYQRRPTLPARMMLLALLSRDHLHSVRDTYTLRHLQALGFQNVVNTACPTLWPLVVPVKHDSPSQRNEVVLTTVTDYRKDGATDRTTLDLILSHYRHAYIWLQGAGDEAYFHSMAGDLASRVTVIPHSYDAFETFLKDGPSFDYIGTRLHGGIRWLTAGKQALIISVDNRAAELARDTGLPTVQRGDYASIVSWINHPRKLLMHLPVSEISRWSQQFDAPRIEQACS